MKKDIRKKILIVEDEEKLRTTVADFLKLYDYNIIEAKDGEEAVREIEDQMNEIDLKSLFPESPLQHDLTRKLHFLEYLSGKVTEIKDCGDTKEVTVNDNSYKAESVIIATGARNRTLNVPGDRYFIRLVSIFFFYDYGFQSLFSLNLWRLWAVETLL